MKPLGKNEAAALLDAAESGAHKDQAMLDKLQMLVQQSTDDVTIERGIQAIANYLPVHRVAGKVLVDLLVHENVDTAATAFAFLKPLSEFLPEVVALLEHERPALALDLVTRWVDWEELAVGELGLVDRLRTLAMQTSDADVIETCLSALDDHLFYQPEEGAFLVPLLLSEHATKAEWAAQALMSMPQHQAEALAALKQPQRLENLPAPEHPLRLLEDWNILSRLGTPLSLAGRLSAHPHSGTRELVAQLLGSEGIGPSAIGPLTALAQDEDGDVRSRATESLANVLVEFDEPEQRSVLQQTAMLLATLADDENESVREYAVRALVVVLPRLGYSQYVPLLAAKLFEPEHAAQSDAVRAAIDAIDPEADLDVLLAEPIQRGLDHTDQSRKVAALKQVMGTEPMLLPAIRKIIDQHQRYWGTTLDAAFAALGRYPIEHGDLSSYLLSLLASPDDEPACRARNVLRPHPEFLDQVLGLLQSGVPKPVYALELVTYWEDDYQRVQSVVRQHRSHVNLTIPPHLIRFGHRATPLLLELLKAPQRYQATRDALFEALLTSADRPTILDAAPSALKSGDFGVHVMERTLEALIQIGGHSIVELLVPVVADPPDAWTENEVRKAIEAIEPGVSIDALVAELAVPAPEKLPVRYLVAGDASSPHRFGPPAAEVLAAPERRLLPLLEIDLSELDAAWSGLARFFYHEYNGGEWVTFASADANGRTRLVTQLHDDDFDGEPMVGRVVRQGHARLVSAADGEIFARIGGDPEWRQGERWPRDDEQRRMAFVGQLDAWSLSDEVGDVTLYLFYSPDSGVVTQVHQST